MTRKISSRAIFVLLLVLLIALKIAEHRTPISSPQASAVTSATRSESSPDADIAVFGHAVVPSGIHSKEEFIAAYPEADVNNVQLIHLKEAIHVYVSYMKNGKIYWTRDLHTYEAGTAVWTDGKIFVLARCGNQIAWELPPDVTTEDFPPGDLDIPVMPVQLLPTDPAEPPVSVYNTPQPPIAAPPSDPGYPSVPYWPVVPVVPVSPPVAVSEASTCLYLALGLIALLIIIKIRR